MNQVAFSLSNTIPRNFGDTTPDVRMILEELIPSLLPKHQCEFLAHSAILARAFERNKLAAFAAPRFVQMGKVQHVQRQNLARWTAITSKKHPLDWQHRSPVNSLALEKKFHFYIQ